MYIGTNNWCRIYFETISTQNSIANVKNDYKEMASNSELNVEF